MTAILVMLTLWLNAGVPACEQVSTLPGPVAVTPYAEGTAYEINGRVLFHTETGDYRFYERVEDGTHYWYAQVPFSPFAIENQVEQGMRTYPLPAVPVCEPSFSSWESTNLF